MQSNRVSTPWTHVILRYVLLQTSFVGGLASSLLLYYSTTEYENTDRKYGYHGLGGIFVFRKNQKKLTHEIRGSCKELMYSYI